MDFLLLIQHARLRLQSAEIEQTFRKHAVNVLLKILRKKLNSY